MRTHRRASPGKATFPILIGVGALMCAPVASATGRAWGPEYFPNVKLTTHEGKEVRFYDDLLKGKAVAINVIYSNCTAVCPLETAKLAQVQKLLGGRVGRDIFFYSISIDPERDSPQVLKAYAERFHAGPGWYFLTGRKQDIQLIGDKLGLTSASDASNPDGHRPTLLVGSEPNGRWMRNSGMDNPRFLVSSITRFLGWKSESPGPSYADLGSAPRVERGSYLFNSRCSACHTIGKGDGVGPDLAGATARRDRRWLERYLAEPDKVLAEKDPVALQLFERYRSVRMPNLGLEPEEVDLLISHIQERGRVAAPQPSPGPTRRDQ